MIVTLILPESLSMVIRALAAEPLETAGVLLVSVIETDRGDIRLLGREFHAVPEPSYVRRTNDELLITSDGYIDAIARGAELGATAVWVHCHPRVGSSPEASRHDALVDTVLAETFRIRTGSEYYGTLIVAPTSSGICFTGAISTVTGNSSEIARVWEVGDRFRLTNSYPSPSEQVLEVFDRNVRAFGSSVQRALGQLRVAVVGCGGTGSAVVEQLVRLGVRDLLLIDPDSLSETNTTRVYGSGPADVGRSKVSIARANVLRIAPSATCEIVEASIYFERVARLLSFSDLVFGCTDDNAGRLILSRLPTFVLVPVIDCGVLISSVDDGSIQGVDGRVTTVLPESACLICRGRIDLGRASAEVKTTVEKQKLQDEGYAPALGLVEPAVVTYTSMVAATAVGELLERLIGFGVRPAPSEVLLRIHEREISTNVASSKPKHYCSAASGLVGSGSGDSFLGLGWVQ